jgi:hypothetical protein
MLMSEVSGIVGGLAMVGMALAACSGDLGGSQIAATEGSGANNGAGGGQGGLNLSSGGNGSSVGGGEECAALEVTPQLVPVSMFITVDKSGSMGSNNKWIDAEAAFNAFFTDPAADNLNVALRFWPDGGCDDVSCNIAGCAVAQVDMGSLSDPAHEMALTNLFASKNPGGNTPMQTALAGAEQYALNYQTNAEAGERIVVVILTDGVPTVCDLSIPNIAQYAADAYTQSEILTFAVGLQGSVVSDINQIAAAGQTGMGYFIGTGNAQQDLLDALLAIQEIAVACTYAIPESNDPNMPTDPNQVNVYYKATPSAEGDLVPKVASAADCGPTGGWYYDDPNDPAIISLCAATCEAANSAPDSGISIKIGCQTIVQ